MKDTAMLCSGEVALSLLFLEVSASYISQRELRLLFSA